MPGFSNCCVATRKYVRPEPVEGPKDHPHSLPRQADRDREGVPQLLESLSKGELDLLNTLESNTPYFLYSTLYFLFFSVFSVLSVVNPYFLRNTFYFLISPEYGILTETATLNTQKP